MNGAEMVAAIVAASSARGEGFSAYTERDGCEWYIVAGERESWHGAERVATTDYWAGERNRNKARAFLLFMFGVDSGIPFRLTAQRRGAATFVDPDGCTVTVWVDATRRAFPEFAARHGIGESAQ